MSLDSCLLLMYMLRLIHQQLINLDVRGIVFPIPDLEIAAELLKLMTLLTILQSYLGSL